MKVPLYNVEGKRTGEVDLPSVFDSEVDAGLIRRAVLSIQSARYQPHAPYVYAGRDNTAVYVGARHYPTPMRTINVGKARKPRLKNRRALLYGNVAGIPAVVGGPKAHPPKVEKILLEKINQKEKKKATASAIAATGKSALVSKRGHRISKELHVPIVLEDAVESLKKTNQVKHLLIGLKLFQDVERAKERKHVRAGKGKRRGRKYKRAKSVLIVTGKKAHLHFAARNLEGVDVVEARNINAELLAPGAVPGRLTVYTQHALKELQEAFS